MPTDDPSEATSRFAGKPRYGASMRSDIEFLGLVEASEPGHYSFEVINRLARLDGYLYGGTAIAASMATAEHLTGAQTVWVTTQFVATAPPGSTVEVHAEVLAAGHRTTQVRVTGTDTAGATMFASLGTMGTRRDEGLDGVYDTMPEVSAPEESEPIDDLFHLVAANAGVTDVPQMPRGSGFRSVVETALPAIGGHPDPGPGRLCAWVRRRDREPLTPAIAAYMADLVPLAVSHAAGVIAIGISLDNSIRVGTFEPTEWVLLDMRAQMATGGYGHGTVHIWHPNGRLLATAGQTASMTVFDAADPPWAR